MVPDEVNKAGKNGQKAPYGQKRTKTHKNFSMHEIAAKDMQVERHVPHVPCSCCDGTLLKTHKMGRESSKSDSLHFTERDQSTLIADKAVRTATELLIVITLKNFCD